MAGYGMVAFLVLGATIAVFFVIVGNNTLKAINDSSDLARAMTSPSMPPAPPYSPPTPPPPSPPPPAPPPARRELLEEADGAPSATRFKLSVAESRKLKATAARLR